MSSESDFSTSIAQEVSDDLGNANLLGDFVEDRVRMQDDNMLFDGPDQENMVQKIAYFCLLIIYFVCVLCIDTFYE